MRVLTVPAVLGSLLLSTSSFGQAASGQAASGQAASPSPRTDAAGREPPPATPSEPSPAPKETAAPQAASPEAGPNASGANASGANASATAPGTSMGGAPPSGASSNGGSAGGSPGSNGTANGTTPNATTANGTPAVPLTAQLTGAPNPNALAPSATDEWRWSTHGYFRAPLRMGIGRRPTCDEGVDPGTLEEGVPCAGPGQSTVNFHSPRLPDDQYLDWRYTRQWERDWTEVFLNFGNSVVVGTVGLQAYNLTDASYNNTNAQFGIAQAYLTFTPKPPIPNLKLQWKVGSFWDRYGMAGKYDAGKYDTYLFGRIHSMGEVLSAEMGFGDITLKAAHGFGAKLEQGTMFPPGFSPLTHAHAGLRYKKLVDLTAHYMMSWSQDARASTTVPDGSMSVAGVDIRITADVYGELYAGFSHVRADHVQSVGPGLEVIHSMGGGGVGGANGLIENYLGTCSGCAPEDVGVGEINTVSVQYDYSFGTLYRKLQSPGTGFWGDGTDLTLSLFGMLTSVYSKDAEALGTNKIKFGADLVYTAFSWLGFGTRLDRVMPSSKDDEQSFWVLSPKIIVRSKFVTHEEVTFQYSRYTYGARAKAQPPYDGTPPDQNVVGLKATLWW